jgi:hypothetical protein
LGWEKLPPAGGEHGPGCNGRGREHSDGMSETILLAVAAISGVVVSRRALGGRCTATTGNDGLWPARIELARRRRAGAAADVLYVRVASSARTAALGAARTLRVTDGASILRQRRGAGIVAVFDPTDRARDPVERRLRERLGDAAHFGWAQFPAEGVTLEALVRVPVVAEGQLSAALAGSAARPVITKGGAG